MRSMPHKFADAAMTPEEHVKTANEMAYRFAADAPIRGLAMAIIGDTDNIFRDGPSRIAHWITENVRYGQESPGIEILQGPYTTLPPGLVIGDFRFGGIGVGDCDDLALLFATLCRAAGLNGFFAGVCTEPFQGSFVHAIGYCADDECFYELSKDEPYGGIPNKPVQMKGVPVGQAAFIWDPALMRWQKFTNNPSNPAQTYSIGSGGMYDNSRMSGTDPFALRARMASGIQVGAPNSLNAPYVPISMGASRQMGSTRGATKTGALKYLTGEAGVDARAASGESTTNSGKFIDEVAAVNEAMYEFGQEVGYGGSTANGGDRLFSEGITGIQNIRDIREEQQAAGLSGTESAPTLIQNGVVTGAGIYANYTGNNAAGRVAKSGLAIYGSTAAIASSTVGALSTTGAITAAAATAAIPVVNVVVAAAVAIACTLTAVFRSRRKSREAERESLNANQRLKVFCQEICGDPRSSLDAALQNIWLYQRIQEFVTITSGNYGATRGTPSRGPWRCAVRTTSYQNHLNVVQTSSGPTLKSMYNWGFGSREYTEIGFARSSFGFMDGCRYTKGINYTCGTQVTPTLRIVQEGSEQIDMLIRMVNDISNACIAGGHCAASGARLREFKLGLTLSVMAQVITLRISTVKQRYDPGRREAVRTVSVENGRMGGLHQTQNALPIDVNRFWWGFQETFGVDRESAVRPVETYFGAPFGTFDDGLMRYQAGLPTNFPIFDAADQQSPDWSESTPGGDGGYGGSGESGSAAGTGLAVAAGLGAIYLLNK
ncbi:MAG: transglutaminase domain-containing protein [Actinomycetia bacterium]|nr:transglutaminase domain-containing protein [Actinomycetes bacterium]